jgi:hypothetical protein
MIRRLLILLTLSTPGFAQHLIEGEVLDSQTGKPVSFASVGIVGTSRGTSSNQNGQFTLSVTPPVSLMVTSVGYESTRVDSVAGFVTIMLKPSITQLDAVIVTNRPINPKRIVRKAFSNITENYATESFLQKFFYRHYCKDGDVHGRLIEASVDVWKNRGYRSTQKRAGESDQIRITQLRRSLDKTVIAQGHEPISVAGILETDLVGYQTLNTSEHLSFYGNVSNLRTDFEQYSFGFKGITYYDGQEVYKITYSYKEDSLLTTSGRYIEGAKATGLLYITTDTYAFIKTEQTKSDKKNKIHTSAYYRKYGDRYYPYHFVMEGEGFASATNVGHIFRIELMSVEIRNDQAEKFTGKLPGREDLFNIPYDSIFWTSNTVLKTTPLEDDIIRDLGGGASLNKQFDRYRQYEMSIRDGGKNAEEKFSWLREDSRNNRILYLFFWDDDFKPYMVDLEYAKRLHKEYRNKITFILISLSDDQAQWQQTVTAYNLHADGIINYRVGSQSKLTKSFDVKTIPRFILIGKNGEISSEHARRPGDPMLKDEFALATEQ